MERALVIEKNLLTRGYWASLKVWISLRNLLGVE